LLWQQQLQRLVRDPMGEQPLPGLQLQGSQRVSVLLRLNDWVMRKHSFLFNQICSDTV